MNGKAKKRVKILVGAHLCSVCGKPIETRIIRQCGACIVKKAGL